MMRRFRGLGATDNWSGVSAGGSGSEAETDINGDVISSDNVVEVTPGDILGGQAGSAAVTFNIADPSTWIAGAAAGLAKVTGARPSRTPTPRPPTPIVTAQTPFLQRSVAGLPMPAVLLIGAGLAIYIWKKR